MTRDPVVAGMFYESDFDGLDKQINDCFTHRLGPGDLPISKRNNEIVGIISPHAGYAYSGACAAWCFKDIAESRFPDVFILIGLSHSGHGSCVSLQDWKTPFGVVKNDKEFTKALTENSKLKVNEDAHSQEHSLEVQLPFLQFVNKDYLDKLRITPIIASHDLHYKDIAESIKRTIDLTKRKVCIICSSDFTHYGINYGFMPFSRNIKENLYKLDNDAIKFIEKMDSKGFLNYVNETGATICGYYGIAVMIELCRLLNASKASLLQYYTSGDIANDYSSAVGYGAIAFK